MYFLPQLSSHISTGSSGCSSSLLGVQSTNRARTLWAPRCEPQCCCSCAWSPQLRGRWCTRAHPSEKIRDESTSADDCRAWATRRTAATSSRTRGCSRSPPAAAAPSPACSASGAATATANCAIPTHPSLLPERGSGVGPRQGSGLALTLVSIILNPRKGVAAGRRLTRWPFFRRSRVQCSAQCSQSLFRNHLPSFLNSENPRLSLILFRAAEA